MDAAFGEALIALLPNLRRFALSLSRKPDLADDLVQITVERAIAGQAGFDRQARLEPWLFRIMRNAWIDMTRRQRSAGTQVDPMRGVDPRQWVGTAKLRGAGASAEGDQISAARGAWIIPIQQARADQLADLFGDRCDG